MVAQGKRMRFSIARPLLLAFILGIFSWRLSPCATAGDVELLALPSDGDYPDAAAPQALQYACAERDAALSSFFAVKSLPFEPTLVRQIGGHRCHIFYQPTIAGFRALPDDRPISEVFMDVDLLSFLTLRKERFGDSLDVAKTVLARIARPLNVVLGLPLHQETEYYLKALAFHFPNSPHRISMRENQTEQSNPWVQDYLKAGVAGGQVRILVPRLAFEGLAENGAAFKPMLDSFNQERFVRSKLSWDGGDLQFVEHPRHPGKLLLLYGGSAKPYWGKVFSNAEYEYVLKLEFGADFALDLSQVVTHIDYFICLLPADRIVLAAEPRQQDFELARAALRLLVEVSQPLGPAELRQLDKLFTTREEAFGRHLAVVRRLIDTLKKFAADWPIPIEQQTGKMVQDYVAAHCPHEPAACVNPEGLRRLLSQDYALTRAWTLTANRVRLMETMAAQLLNIIESQLPGAEMPAPSVLESKIAVLEQAGFKVIRIPRMVGDAKRTPPWAGISYANSALIDQVLFVPEFGLGEWEKSLYERLQQRLPPKYKVVPVYAQYLLVRNGGVHCSMAFVRQPAKQ